MKTRFDGDLVETGVVSTRAKNAPKAPVALCRPPPSR